MADAAFIKHYFPEISEEQEEKFTQLGELYAIWNDRINVISRKDMGSFYERHVLHSLGIAKFMSFEPGTKVLDVGTGGGFPGIPLAILYPDCEFVLVDSIGKKIRVVNEVVQALGLGNVTAFHQRAEKTRGKFDFVVSRAVTRMKPFLSWVHNKIEREGFNLLPNGVLYLKGGDLEEELEETKRDYELFDLSTVYKGEFFETKKVVYVPFI
jgi:16S rRNA (guanine527-N7)-methyltransferase